MATASFCDPCSDEHKSISATNYCSDCEERLCTDCAESHVRFKAFKSHQVFDMSSVGSNIPIYVKKMCNVHEDMRLDYYCTDHQIVCCRACIPKDHRTCDNVLPLEHASKDVKKSALFTEVMQNIKHLITTLNHLHDNREANLHLLEKTKSVITKQISEVKSRLFKQIDDLERDLHTKLSSLQLKHEIEINTQKEEVLYALETLKSNENEIDFLKDHGSNTQLFISLLQQVTNIQTAAAKVQHIVSNSQEIEITFDEKNVKHIDSFGQLSETVNPCQVQYKSTKLQQAQIMTDTTKRIIGFVKETELKLKSKGMNDLRDVSITNDNKLLLTDCSSFNLYVYRDCKDYETEMTFSVGPYGVDVIHSTDIAVVTLPKEHSIQFLNTKTMTKGDKVNVGIVCYGITAGRDIIYVGGEDNTIKTLDNNGTMLKSIKHGLGGAYFMSYNYIHDQCIARNGKLLYSIKLDDIQVYSNKLSGVAGVTHDRQGNIYFCGYFSNNIQIISSDGKPCEEMLNKDDGINCPYGLCFNNDFTKLFVINKNCTSVYRCK